MGRECHILRGDTMVRQLLPDEVSNCNLTLLLSEVAIDIDNLETVA